MPQVVAGAALILNSRWLGPAIQRFYDISFHLRASEDEILLRIFHNNAKFWALSEDRY